MIDVLVIAPHPDDAELGMAGAIMKMGDDGLKVGILDMTNGEPTPHGSPEIRERETAAATEILGCAWRGNLGLLNRKLEHTMEARAKLAGAIRELRPRWLFSPYWVDAHPDHVAAVEMIDAARFWSKLTKSELPHAPHHPERIWHYNCVHLRVVEKPAFVLDISKYWDRKLAAISCYHSQFIAGRPTEPPTILDRLRDQAAYWGWSINAKYGEGFHSREAVGLTSFRDLI